MLRLLNSAYAIFICATFCGCAASPPVADQVISRDAVESNDSTSPGDKLGDEIALRAIAQVGTRYRYGGADLDGFDCSGLVYFIHRELGIAAPRTAAEQYAASMPVNVHRLKPGDLLFFRTTKRRHVSHVAIYAGGGRFVDAPQTGKLIELRSLDDDYYRPRLIGAGRLRPMDSDATTNSKIIPDADNSASGVDAQ